MRHFSPFKNPRGSGRAICRVPQCYSVTQGWGYCGKHYYRWRVHGDPLKLKQRPPRSGTITKRGYKLLTINGKRVWEHRYVMEQQLGWKLHRWEHIHHKNRIQWDNRPENLEVLDSRIHKHRHAKYYRDEYSKQCARCLKVLPRDRFHVRHSTNYSHDKSCQLCKRCTKTMNRLRYKPSVVSRSYLKPAYNDFGQITPRHGGPHLGNG